ncbi:hypothetical protein BH09SUM1_BH09SUM1_14880 [soil metagenome]
MNLQFNKPPNEILGIDVRRHSITVVEVAGGAMRSFHANLAIDVLTGASDLAGAEIAAALAKTNVRTRRCVACVPPDWVMTHTLELPELSEEDVASFLDLEAERAFPLALQDVALSISRFTSDEGKAFATLVAMPLNHVTTLSNVFRHAKLKLTAITVGAAVLAIKKPEPVSAVLVASDRSIDFAVAANGGIAALRALAIPGEEAEADAQDLARELRLSIRRSVAYKAGGVRSVHLYGQAARRQWLLELLRPGFASQEVSLVANTEGGDANGFESSAAAEAAARIALSGGTFPLQFYHARPVGIHGFASRLRQRGMLLRVAGIAAVCFFLLMCAFAYRQIRLSSLRSQWSEMSPQVVRLEAIQEDIRRWRPWFDADPNSLNIMQSVTSAFPENGQTWARLVQVRDQNIVSCMGFGKTNEDCLKLFEALRKTKGIQDLKVSQIRGEKPVQFSITFRWKGIGAS